MVEISVIIPAYGHCPYLPDLLTALLDGTHQPHEIIVSHSGPDDPTEEVAAFSPSITVLHHSHRLLGGAARNRGAAMAKGVWLVFIDADVRPCPDWLAKLSASVDQDAERFVVGSVGYATTGGYWGMCNWLAEFSEQAPWHPARRQNGGASCNMIVSADDFNQAGEFPEDYQPGEDTALYRRLIAMGREQWFEPAARVDHHNQHGLRTFMRHQYRLGYHSALVRQRFSLRGSVATRVRPLALFLWVPRLALLARRLFAGGPAWWLRGAVYAPGLFAGSLLWTAGFVSRVMSADKQQPAGATH